MSKTDYFRLSLEDADIQWAKAVIVLDTSTLGNMYCMAEEPKKALIEIFGTVVLQDLV